MSTAGSETRRLDKRWYDATPAGRGRTPRQCCGTRAYQARQPGRSYYLPPSAHSSPALRTPHTPSARPPLDLGQSRRPAAPTFSSPIYGKMITASSNIHRVAHRRSITGGYFLVASSRILPEALVIVTDYAARARVRGGLDLYCHI